MNQPGLAFYVAYAHVSEIAKHLACVKEETPESCIFDVAASSVFASIELLVELLYRVEVLDKRPGFDKEGLILSIQDFISQSLALLEKTEIGYARQQQHKPNQGTTKLCEEKKQNDIVGVSISDPTSSSMFNVLVEALKTDKDLLS